jgi:hypothetical protein
VHVLAGRPATVAFVVAALVATGCSDDSTEPSDALGPSISLSVPTLTPPDLGARLTPADGVWFRLSLRGGPHDGHISLDEAGQLVMVDGGLDVRTTPEQFVAYQLTPTGVRAMVDLIEASEALAGDNTRWGELDPTGPGVSAGLFHSGCCVVEAHQLFVAHPELDDATTARRRGFEKLLDRITDPSWLGDDITGPQPWVPETITVHAGPTGVDAAPDLGEPQAWPLAAPIRTLAQGTTDRPYTDAVPYLCLHGDDAAAVFALLHAGTNTAWLPVRDTEEEYWLTLEIQLPGYRLYGDPCADTE